MAKRMGPTTLLTKEEVLANHINSAQRWAVPVTKETAISLVSLFLSDERNEQEINGDRPYKFEVGVSLVPGELWYRGFLKRHPNIVIRMTENESLNISRRNVSESVVKQLFSDIRSYLSDNDMLDVIFDDKRNFNIHKSGFLLSPRVTKVLAEKGSKNVHYGSTGKEKERLTFLGRIILF
nr:uncharacterized protein LOC124806257 [Hydra vulgaris]